LAAGVLLPLVVVANASAQGATLRLNPSTAGPGQAIAVTSSASFSSAAGTSPVSIRLSTRDGRVLASTSPDTRGRISATFPIPPSLAPGTYLILATQTNEASGTQRGFTPGRAVLRVAGSSGASSASPGGGSTGGGPPAQLPAVAIALALLAGGCALTIRRLLTFNRALGS